MTRVVYMTSPQLTAHWKQKQVSLRSGVWTTVPTLTTFIQNSFEAQPQQLRRKQIKEIPISGKEVKLPRFDDTIPYKEKS